MKKLGSELFNKTPNTEAIPTFKAVKKANLLPTRNQANKSKGTLTAKYKIQYIILAFVSSANHEKLKYFIIINID